MSRIHCNESNRIKSKNDNMILFPKKPNKRYQLFISKEKQKYDENWENKLKDQNLTDPNFFLNYYSYENKRSKNFSNEDQSNLISLPKKSLSNSLPSCYFQNKKTFTVITGKGINEKPLYQVGSSFNKNFEICGKNSDENQSKNSVSENSDFCLDDSDSENINEEFDILSQSFKSKTLNYPIVKLVKSSFSKTSNFLPVSSQMSQSNYSKSSLLSNEKVNDELEKFLNIDRTTQFAPLPKRQAKTRRKNKKSKKKILRISTNWLFPARYSNSY